MKRILSVILVALFLAPVVAVEKDSERDMITLRAKLRARNPDQVKDELIALAGANKGYLLRLSARRIEVYVARELTAPGIINKLSGYGQLVERSVGRKDVSDRMRDLETSIRVREDHLAKLQKMVAGSNAEQTLELEKELNRVISEIERNRGQLNFYRERVSLIHLRVDFTSSASPSTTGGIPIDWVRDLNIEDFMERF